MSESQPALPNRQIPFSDAFRAFIGESWAPYSHELPDLLPAAFSLESLANADE